MPYEYNPDDKFGYKDTLPENHPEKVITGVEFDDEFKKIAGAIDSLEDATTGDGQFVDAPSDGQLYGRKDRDWEAISDGSNDWSDIENKPTEFPPSPHTHPWGEITDKPSSYPPGPHDHDGQYVEEAPNDGKQYVRESEAWAEVDIPEGGSSVHIGENPPDSPQEGQQWMEVPASGDATMWIYDGANWLQQPGGKDGADGADGVGGLWTDNGGSISYTGTVTVTGELLAAKSDAGANAVAVGVLAGETGQGQSAVAIGWESGSVSQSMDAVAVGRNAGQTTQGEKAVSVGRDSGFNNQADYAVGVGFSAGKTNQGARSIAIGSDSAGQNQSNDALAIGAGSGYQNQGQFGTAVGRNAGSVTQGESAVAVGYGAGENNQGPYTVAVGNAAGESDQEEACVAVGVFAGRTSQGVNAIAVGGSAGNNTQGDWAVSIGQNAGMTSQGAASIAIGRSAGQTDQAANGIIISSHGSSAENSGNPNHIYIVSGSDKYLYYNGSTEWYFAGGPVNGLNGFRQNGAPVIDAKGLISTLSALRNATMDETQDIRESLRSAIDELVAGFEQEIAAMPAGGPQ